MNNITDDLLRWARQSSAAPFLIEESGEVYCYGEVLRRARLFAGGLIEHGIRQGDRVVLLLPNGVDYLCAYYGTLVAGGTVVGLQLATTPPALAHVVSNCQPKLCLIDPERQYSDLSGTGLDRVHATRELMASPPYDGLPVGGGDEIAQIIYTSGTTGKAKGVMLSHRALRANTSGVVDYLRLGPSDRVGVVFDFVYSYGNSLLQTHCRVGGSLALLGGLAFPARVVDRLHDRACTGLSGVPSTFALLLQRGQLERRSPTALRYLTCAGGPLPTANLHRLQRLFPGVEIFLMYGQTEASARLSYLPTEELKRRPKSIGKGMPGVLLEVLNSAGSPAGVGEEGEIVACGENLMSGYWGDSEATRQALRDGKLWTADLATVDEEGFIHITGRRSDLIKTGAYRVHPEEIEETIVSMDGVHECVVVGVPDETWGETIVACFLEGTSPPIADIRKHLRGVLPEYKWPRDVVEVEELPRTTSGKPKRRELVKMLISGNPGGAPAEVRGAKPHHD